MTRTTLYGWGRTSPSVADVRTPSTEDEVLEALAGASPVLARGLGRSYGDAAQLAGGTVLTLGAFGAISSIASDGVVSVGAGVSVDDLLRVAIPQGWFIPVTPGTRQVTLGGALAADVHGKNHHVDGSIGRHVRRIRLATPTGAHELTPEHELFWASVGGMGLTGIITEIELQLLPIETDRVLVDTKRLANLDDLMNEMITNDHLYRYSVAWVDCTSPGKALGRGVLTRGNHAHESDVGVSLRAPSGPRLSAPPWVPSGLLNAASIRCFNELWYRVAPKDRERHPENLSTFFHPLDGLSNWNRLYGRRGFVQYQFVVPDAAHERIREAITMLSSAGLPSFLAVLKRFGAANAGLLSFPLPGWTLALDIPVGRSDLGTVLDAIDDLVVEAGGRVYLAKDARLDPRHVPTMYPGLDRFRSLQRQVDPEGVLSSDLSRRLGLLQEK